MSTGKSSKSFAWLNATQFLGALNDNVFKWLVIFFLVRLKGEEHQPAIMTTASVLFVTPFLLFSHSAGVLADRFSKRNIIVILKWAELAVMILGLWAVSRQNVFTDYVLYGLIFIMCAQSAFFGPSKYGIIPELVPKSRLSASNSFLIAMTNVAIIIGTFLPAYFLDNLFPGCFSGLAYVCALTAVLGVLSAKMIDETPAVGRVRNFTPWFVADILRTLKDVGKDRYLLMTILGTAYFWYLGAFVQLNLLMYGQDYMGMRLEQSGYLFPVAAVGIGLGALIAGKVSGQNIEFGIVPVGAMGLTLSCVALKFIPADVLIAGAVVLVLGMSSGMFLVPLEAFVQFKSPPDKLGEILATQNFITFLAIALGAGTFQLFSGVWNVPPADSFAVIGAMTGILALVTMIVLPDFLIRFLILCITRMFYRIKTVGIENLPVTGGALLVSNHVTWIDALLISATCQRRIRFMMLKDIYERRLLNPLFRLMKVIPVSSTDSPRQIIRSLNEARSALDGGNLVCIFAEGALTRNGNMSGFRAGFERIVRNTSHPVIPVFIGNAWGSIFSYYHGRLFWCLPHRIPYHVSVSFGNAMPSLSTAQEVRRNVQELSLLSFHIKKNRRRVLPFQFIGMARSRWFKTAVRDTTGRKMSFGSLLIASVILARKLRGITRGQEDVGIILPASVAGVIANIAVTLAGKTSVNLNFTASMPAMLSAIRQCGLKTIITSRAFTEKLGDCGAIEGKVFLEDLAKRTGFTEKISGFLASFAPAPMRACWGGKNPDDVATVIFSSGSTSEPKGVMLSHHNIISNIEAFRHVFKIEQNDRMCGVLPFFHSFGYTTTLWCPAISGFPVYYHANPIEGAKVAEIIREFKATILLATPTFLLSYIKGAQREDFTSLRAVLTGAEKLRGKVADSFEKKFGIRPLEGYGATELSPVAALNVPDVDVGGVKQVGTKEGSVGHPLPGVTMKVVDPDSGVPLSDGEAGLLFVKGPNVMLGYRGNREKTAEMLKGGWYNTGDIAKIDSDGFVYIIDRLSRYSKIGGEMVPHIALEEKFMELSGGVRQSVFVTSAPDEKKGEQIVVLYTDEAGDAGRLYEMIKGSSLPNLWKPKRDNYFRIDSAPTLGSGKVDLKKIREIAGERVENRPGVIRRLVERITDKLDGMTQQNGGGNEA